MIMVFIILSVLLFWAYMVHYWTSKALILAMAALYALLVIQATFG
jgi:hypothetical protein